MYAYQRYLLDTRTYERKRQRRYRYCDGTMQKYLNACWNDECDDHKHQILKTIRECYY